MNEDPRIRELARLWREGDRQAAVDLFWEMLLRQDDTKAKDADTDK